MRAHLMALLLVAAGLAACNRDDAANEIGPTGKSPGRYAGIGTFDAGRLWQQVAGAPQSQDPAAAKLADDEHIIVVLDSHTGEVRQCGDHSGVCVAMNPWSGKGGAPIPAPARLAKHAADLDAEAEKAASDTNVNNVASEAAPAR
ncbi:MAG TPA: hypothetical protein VF079_04715 [Sphingomicrobium sp.]